MFTPVVPLPIEQLPSVHSAPSAPSVDLSKIEGLLIKISDSLINIEKTLNNMDNSLVIILNFVVFFFICFIIRWIYRYISSFF